MKYSDNIIKQSSQLDDCCSKTSFGYIFIAVYGFYEE